MATLKTNTDKLLNLINDARNRELKKDDIRTLFLTILNGQLMEGKQVLTPQLLRRVKSQVLDLLHGFGYSDITISTLVSLDSFTLRINAPLGYKDHSVIGY